jgi:DNA repair protein RadC
MKTPHNAAMCREQARTIKSWATDDRPREKMLQKNAQALSDVELLAILIGSGTRNRTAIDLAREIMGLCDNQLGELSRMSLSEIMQVKGIGTAKAIHIGAALELGRRRQFGKAPQKSQIKTSKDIAELLRCRLQDLDHEVFGVAYLNQANRVNDFEIISSGGITGTVADPRIILRKALEKKAVSIILCHNHPSGNLQPSRADEQLTEKIRSAASLMDIRLLDHIIVSDQGYYSFADEGLL